MRKTLFFCLTLGLNSAAFAEAQISDIIVVNGTNFNEATITLQEISVEDIVQNPPFSVADILRNASGLTVIQPGGAGRAEVAIQGAEANFTVVLIDGIRVNDPTNSRGGSFDFTTLSPTEIERIDVLTGGFSGIYGSDALSGVINVITKGPGSVEASKFSGAAIIGEAGYYNFGGTVRLPGQFSLTAAHHDVGEGLAGLEHSLTSVQAKGRKLFIDGEVAGTVRATKGKGAAYPDASGGPLYAINDTLELSETDTFLVGGSVVHNLSDIWSTHFNVGYSARSDNIQTPSIAEGMSSGRPAINAETDYARAHLTAFARGKLSANISTVLGVDIVEEDGQTVSSTDFGFFAIPGQYELNRTSLAGFAEGRLQLSDSTAFSAGLRFDSIDEKPETSWQAELIQRTSGPTLSLRYAQAFKAPSFYALGDALVGNSNLKPEESKNWQASLKQNWGNTQISLRLFNSSFSNLIDFDFTTFSLVNRGTTNIRGGDSSAIWTSSNDKVRLKGQLSYVRTKIDGTREQLPGRPKWSGGVNAIWKLYPDLTLSAQSEWIGNRPGNSVPTGPRNLKAYNRQNMTVTYHAAESLDIFVSGSNVFDADIEEAVGVLSPGATLRLGLRYNH